MPRGLGEFRRRNEIHDAIEQTLAAAWRNMMDGAGPENVFRLQGMVDLAEEIGGLTVMEARGWREAVQHCPENTQADPGHNGGRDWCAYCGNIERPEDRRALLRQRLPDPALCGVPS